MNPSKDIQPLPVFFLNFYVKVTYVAAMKLLVPALFALLSPVVLASQNICHPPKSTTIGFLALSEAHSYTVNDYEKGIVYFAPAGDIFGEPWEYVDLNANITYRKESGQDCVYEALDPGLREVGLVKHRVKVCPQARLLFSQHIITFIIYYIH